MPATGSTDQGRIPKRKVAPLDDVFYMLRAADQGQDPQDHVQTRVSCQVHQGLVQNPPQLMPYVQSAPGTTLSRYVHRTHVH